MDKIVEILDLWRFDIEDHESYKSGGSESTRRLAVLKPKTSEQIAAEIRAELKQEIDKSLRDEFAMAALTGIQAHRYKQGGAGEFPNSDAQIAYQYADAMLKVRVEPPKD